MESKAGFFFAAHLKKVQPFLCHAGQHCHCVQPGPNLRVLLWHVADGRSIVFVSNFD